MDNNRVVVYECEHIDYPFPAWVWVPEYDKMAVVPILYGYKASCYPAGTRLTVTVTIEKPDAAKPGDDTARRLIDLQEQSEGGA